MDEKLVCMFNGRVIEGAPVGDYEEIAAWLAATFGPLEDDDEDRLITAEEFFSDHTIINEKTKDGKFKFRIEELITVDDVKDMVKRGVN